MKKSFYAWRESRGDREFVTLSEGFTRGESREKKQKDQNLR